MIPEEFKNFKSLKKDYKANILYQYLVEGGNMDKVAERLGIDNSQKSQSVSHVTRGYGFAGNNSRGFFTLQEVTDAEGNPIKPELKAFQDYVKKYPSGFGHISGEGNVANTGEDNLRQFLIDYYSKSQSSQLNIPNINFNSEWLTKYGKWGCLAFLALLIVAPSLGALLSPDSLLIPLLILGVVVYYWMKKSPAKPTKTSGGRQERWKLAVFIERFVMLFWIIGSCGPMLIDGFPIWSVLLAAVLISLVVMTVVRGLEYVLKRMLNK